MKKELSPIATALIVVVAVAVIGGGGFLYFRGATGGGGPDVAKEEERAKQFEQYLDQYRGGAPGGEANARARQGEQGLQGQ
jgi:hypothetical protein